MNSTLKRMVAPGLPTWPILLYDAKQRRAIVKARFATWRSHEWAKTTTWWMAVVIFVGLSAYWWRTLPNEPGKWFPFLIGVFVILIVVKLLSPYVDIAMRGFLARQIFAKRLTVWFTPDVIAFRSPLYTNGVLLHRIWNGLKVVCKFDLAKDHMAQNHQRSLKPERSGDCQHLELAHLLRVLVTTGNRTVAVNAGTAPNLVRAISVSEISLLDAERMTMVLAAAVSLTSARPNSETDEPSTGFDIDALKPTGD